MSWKHSGSLALLTLTLAACGGPPGTEAGEEPSPTTQHAPAVEPPPTGNTGGADTPAPPPGAGAPVPEEVSPSRVRLVPEEYPTIQAAVDAARPRDTVRVAPGVYSENVRLRSGIRLEGSGAHATVLDGRGMPRNLVDFTGATDVEIRGFTFRNVGSTGWCTMTWEMDRWCSGNWYAAGVYADGHTATSAVIEQNIFEQNDTAVLLYHHAIARVRNNLFFRNTHALAFSYFQDSASAEGNIFWGNTSLAIGVQAGYIDIRGNIIAGSFIGIGHEYIQTGDIGCNLFFQNEHHELELAIVPSRVRLGEGGNEVGAPAFLDPDAGDFRQEPGTIRQTPRCLDGAYDTGELLTR
ncbi:MAG TPA: NosD domain-containing protein [Myxococcus sp.]|nr:NosD domain-containing protein [Myxococcus sp.]